MNNKTPRSKFYTASMEKKQCQFCGNLPDNLMSQHPLKMIYLYMVQQVSQQVHTDTQLKHNSVELHLKCLEYERTSNSRKIQYLYQCLQIKIQATLFQKFSSQNYYYTRDINQIMGQGSYRSYIIYKDYQMLDTKDEYLKRIYSVQEVSEKLGMLSSYYKFHKDIPRIYMIVYSPILNKYLDKKRKLEYYQIERMIKEENKQNPNRPPRGIIGSLQKLLKGEKPSRLHTQDKSNDNQKAKLNRISNILKDLTFLKQDVKTKPKLQKNQQNKQNQEKQQQSDQSQTINEICSHIPTLTQAKPLEIDLAQYQHQHRQLENFKLNSFLKHLQVQISNKPFQDINSKVTQSKFYTDQGAKQYRILSHAQQPLPQKKQNSDTRSPNTSRVPQMQTSGISLIKVDSHLKIVQRKESHGSTLCLTSRKDLTLLPGLDKQVSNTNHSPVCLTDRPINQFKSSLQLPNRSQAQVASQLRQNKGPLQGKKLSLGQFDFMYMQKSVHKAPLTTKGDSVQITDIQRQFIMKTKNNEHNKNLSNQIVNLISSQQVAKMGIFERAVQPYMNNGSQTTRVVKPVPQNLQFTSQNKLAYSPQSNQKTKS